MFELVRDPELLGQVEEWELTYFYVEEQVLQDALQIAASQLIGR